MNSIQRRIFFISFFFAIAVFLAHFYLVKTAVYGDGRYYYSYLPTFLIEHTFNFSKTFHVYGLPFIYTPTHFLQDPLPIGPALTWSLPYLVSYLLFSLIGNANPYNALVQIPVGIWSITMVFAGLFFLFLSLHKFFSKQLSFLVILTIFFSTNLFFYGALDVLNSHSSSFFFTSLALYAWLSAYSLQNTILLGISIGMATLSHTQDIIFFLLPLATLLQRKSSYIRNFLVVIAGLLLCLFPQSYLWAILWGNPLKSPFTYTFVFNFFQPNIIGVLFNWYDGFFLWTPITLLAAIGLYFFVKKHFLIGIPMAVIILIEVYFIASWNIWWEGASYSARIFISLLPFLSFGLAQFYKQFLSGKKQVFLSICFSLLNIALIVLFLLKVKQLSP